MSMITGRPSLAIAVVRWGRRRAFQVVGSQACCSGVASGPAPGCRDRRPRVAERRRGQFHPGKGRRAGQAPGSLRETRHVGAVQGWLAARPAAPQPEPREEAWPAQPRSIGLCAPTPLSSADRRTASAPHQG